MLGPVIFIRCCYFLAINGGIDFKTRSDSLPFSDGDDDDDDDDGKEKYSITTLDEEKSSYNCYLTENWENNYDAKCVSMYYAVECDGALMPFPSFVFT